MGVVGGPQCRAERRLPEGATQGRARPSGAVGRGPAALRALIPGRKAWGRPRAPGSSFPPPYPIASASRRMPSGMRSAAMEEKAMR